MLREPPAAAATSTRTSQVAIAAIAVALAIPRVLRMLYPQVWIEDDSYLHNAFLLARGYLPYRDFPMPHLPALEALLAALFQTAPISIRTAETVTQLAAYAGSILVFQLGRRLGGIVSGIAAASIFATSGLLFRYHVFEREVFMTVPVLGAALLWLSADDGDREQQVRSRRAVAAGAMMFLALAIKLTAVASLAGLVVYFVITGRRRSAALLGATAIVLLALTMAALTAAFGTDFLVQVMLFRAVHATFPSLGVKLYELRYTMDISLAFGVAGIALIVWNGDVRRWLGPLLQIACGFVLLILINPTYWPHTGIELLPWLSLLAGYLAAEAVHRPPSHAGRRALARTRARRDAAFVCAAGGVAIALWVTPIRNLNWEAGDGSVYGFGYRDRAELDAIGRYVMNHSAPGEVVAAPPLIAFVANRREAIPYAEIAGTIQELTESVRRDGYSATLRSKAASAGPLWEEVDSSRERMAPALRGLLDAREVAVLVNDSPDDLMAVPLVDVADEDLLRYGYRTDFATAHYRAWVPR